jgi:hypothetical protein
MASPQSAPLIIRMFLPSGTPDGIKIVEKSNWAGRAVVGPGSRFDELRKRAEFSKTGVYVLTGQPDPDGLPTVYIGEWDPVADRLISHYKAKDFWSMAVFFINNGKDDHLNKAHVQYLESRLAALAREARRCILDNANMPQLPALSEMDTAEIDEFLDQTLLICGVLGVNVFQKAASIAPSTRLLFINVKGLNATGYEVDDGFVVRAGSQSPKEPAPTVPASVEKLRQIVVSEGVFEDERDRYRVVQDYTFSSPSLAAAVMLARSALSRPADHEAGCGHAP